MNELNVCPGTLKKGFSTFSPACLKELFGGKSVSHVLPYHSIGDDEETSTKFVENRKRISISGVQEKLSLKVDGRQLVLTEADERGTYLLKPIPRDLVNVKEVPANEHLTMQIAKQVYKLDVAPNALVFFQDGTPAYITKRFDLLKSGQKASVEDFASLAGRTNQNGGENFKYDYSYEEMGQLIKRYIPSWRVEVEKFYRLVLFNYLFSNGDAHLKNFSVIETSAGDYQLSPAYDLINTKLHVSDSAFALSKGLFSDGFKSEKYSAVGAPTADDFREFGRRLGIVSTRINKLLYPFLAYDSAIEELISHSFLSKKTKRGYLQMYRQRRNTLT